MAKSRRVEKFSALIRKEISQLLIHGIRDEKIQQNLISITEVEVSNDLQHCKIFVSFFGNENQKEDILLALDMASGFFKGELARRLQMRRAPEIVFKLDKGMQKGASVLGILGKLAEERIEKSSISLSEDE